MPVGYFTSLKTNLHFLYKYFMQLLQKSIKIRYITTIINYIHREAKKGKQLSFVCIFYYLTESDEFFYIH